MAIDEITLPKNAPRIKLATLLSLSDIPDSNKLSLNKPPRTFSESTIQESVGKARNLMAKWDPTSPSPRNFTSLFQENRTEAKGFIRCVEELRWAMHFLVAQRSHSDQLVAANSLMKVSMLRLEKEFYYILSAYSLSPESVSGDSSEHSLWPPSFRFSSEEEIEDGDCQTSNVEIAMADLKMIAQSMIRCGYSKECGKIYRVTRKSIVDEEVYRLGIKSYNQSHILRLDHKSLQSQVDKWIRAAKIAVESIFRGEKLLCDRVFGVSETMKQTCFAQTTMEGAINLLRFSELVAKSKRTPEKIFLLINLYETVSDLLPEIESIFEYELLSPIKLQALASMNKLSESTQAILTEFVSSVQKNSSKTLPPGGGIHPLTEKVMDYVILLADSAGTLSDILAGDAVENAAAVRSPFPESYFDSASPTSNSGVASRLAWIVLVLLCKLDSKAEFYKDIGQSYLFLANNLQFIVDRVGATSLRFLLGEDWMSKLQKKVKIYTSNYESVAWKNVVAALPAAEAEASPAAIKESFRKFNAAFEAAYRKQSAWTVPDPKLRDGIKVSIARKLVPAYRSFYESCYVAILNEERNLEVLVRFSPENLGNYLSDLFHVAIEIREDSSPLMSHSKFARCL